MALLGACIEDREGGGIVALILFAIGGWFISLEKNEIHNFFGLSIETNSGSNELFFSKDKDFIEKIRDMLSKALSNNNIRTTIHIGDKNFVDNSVTNNKINQNTYYNLNIEHHDFLTKEEETFLLNDFKESIEKLYNELGSIKEAQLTREKLNEIVKEINSDKPDTGKIKQSYEKIKSIADGYNTVSSLSEFGGIIGRTIMMFIS